MIASKKAQLRHGRITMKAARAKKQMRLHRKRVADVEVQDVIASFCQEELNSDECNPVFGTMQSDGCTYAGGWEADLYHGFGQLTQEDGHVLVGIWGAGVLVEQM